MIKVQENWGVLVSQTGSEVIAIAKEIGFLPSLLVTNHISRIPQDNLRFFGENGVIIRTIPFRPALKDYLFLELLEKKLVTLHGFLRILPPELFSQFKGQLYNGHPGLITYYPELKGKDPQVRAWERKYETVGSVVHRVTEGVDEGEVVRFTSIPNTAQSLDEMFYILRSTSLQAWKNFFTNNWRFE